MVPRCMQGRAVAWAGRRLTRISHSLHPGSLSSFSFRLSLLHSPPPAPVARHASAPHHVMAQHRPHVALQRPLLPPPTLFPNWLEEMGIVVVLAACLLACSVRLFVGANRSPSLVCPPPTPPSHSPSPVPKPMSANFAKSIDQKPGYGSCTLNLLGPKPGC